MDALEHEGLFKTDFSCLCGLAEAKMLDEKDLSLVYVLAFDSLHFF